MPTFAHGKATEVYMQGLDLSSHLRTVTASADVDVAEASTFADDDKVFVVGQTDATMSAEGLMDTTMNGSVTAVIAAGTEQAYSYYPTGSVVGSPGFGVWAAITSYEVTSDLGDVVGISLEVQSDVGLERMLSHFALAQVTTSGTATVVDNAGSSTAGAYGYLHATAVSGTVTVKVQDSADNVTYADILTLGTLTAATGPVGLRSTVSGTIRRYTRLVYTATAGTATFVAGFGRNP